LLRKSSDFTTLCKEILKKRVKKVPFTCSKEWQIFFRKSVAKIENGHFLCPILKYGKTFPKKRKLPLHN